MPCPAWTGHRRTGVGTTRCAGRRTHRGVRPGWKPVAGTRRGVGQKEHRLFCGGPPAVGRWRRFNFCGGRVDWGKAMGASAQFHSANGFLPVGSSFCGMELSTRKMAAWRWSKWCRKSIPRVAAGWVPIRRLPYWYAPTTNGWSKAWRKIHISPPFVVKRNTDYFWKPLPNIHYRVVLREAAHIYPVYSDIRRWARG